MPPRPRLRLLAGLLTLLTALAPRPALADGAPAPAPDPKVVEAKAAAELVAQFKAESAEVRARAFEESKQNQHPTVTAALLKALEDDESTDRLAALEALATRTEAVAKRQAATALSTRLNRLFKAQRVPQEQTRILEVLHDLAQPAALKPLLDEVGLDVSPAALAARLKAVANIPTAEAVEAIIQFRSAGGHQGDRRELGYRRRYAREAFQYAVGVDVGHDPDAMRRWWTDNKKGFDFEAAAARRASKGGGPKAKDTDGTSADTGR